MPVKTIDPRSIKVSLWNLARSYRVLRAGNLGEREIARWPASDIKVLDDLIATHFPDRDPEDIFSALKFMVRGRAILDGYDTHLSFIQDAEVFLQPTTDGERVYTVNFGLPDVLPNYYYIIPLAYEGGTEGGLIADLENDLANLPSRAPVRWLDDMLPAQPQAVLRNELYRVGGYIYNGWMLPAALTEADLRLMRDRTLYTRLVRMLTDGDVLNN